MSAVFVFALLVVFASVSTADTRISLKNGRTIIADSCRESDGKIVCEKMGGTFSFEKSEILNLKEITLKRSNLSDSQTLTAEPEASGEKKEAEKKPAESKDGSKPAEGALIKGLSPEAAKQLDEIEIKKKEYQAERERLINERAQLHEDVKNMGMLRNQEQYDALKKRIADLEARINTFNETVKRLNEEEQKILGSSRNTQ